MRIIGRKCAILDCTYKVDTSSELGQFAGIVLTHNNNILENVRYQLLLCDADFSYIPICNYCYDIAVTSPVTGLTAGLALLYNEFKRKKINNHDVEFVDFEEIAKDIQFLKNND
jgi:hypothetical protein